MSDQETTAIEKVETVNNPTTVTVMTQSRGILRPVATIEESLAAWHEYQNLQTKLAGEGDFVDIQGKQHPTKQFANKLRRAFGLSVEIVKAEKEVSDDAFTWHVWVRATHPNGQFNDGDGHCSSRERKFSHIEHDVYATAVTRAKNRAILELAGFGEVSKEEIIDDNAKPAPAQFHPTTKPTVMFTSPKDGKKYAVSMDGALKAFATIKKELGEEKYYECLTTFQVDHANQIPFRDMPKVFDIMIDMAKK